MITLVNISGFSSKLVCIDIMEIWFGITGGQISSIFDSYTSRNKFAFYFQDNNLSKFQWIFTKFDIWRVSLALLISKFRLFLT